MSAQYEVTVPAAKGQATGPSSNRTMTDELSARSAALDLQEVPAEVVEIAQQCLLDMIGVAIAGMQEPVSQIVLDDCVEEGGNARCSLIGSPQRVSALQAALINGTAAHALDYDDVNMDMPGHPSAAIAPAVIAACELQNSSGEELLAAFIAGYETACRVGLSLAPDHYERGFHATATIGAFGAAAGAARALRLSAAETARALGIVSTTAAGLKVNFGTMCKPLHAGLAARNGLHAAVLASRGLTSRHGVLEMRNGFRETHFGSAIEPRWDRSGFALRDNLFKYHAACYNTHSAIEAALRAFKQLGVQARQVRQVTVSFAEGLNTVCNIASPSTGLEAKFSCRFAVAAAILGLPTDALETFSDENVRRTDVVNMIDRIQVDLEPRQDTNVSRVRIVSEGGKEALVEHDAGIPERVVQTQWTRLTPKFMSLVETRLGHPRATEIVALIKGLRSLSSVRDLIRATS